MYNENICNIFVAIILAQKEGHAMKTKFRNRITIYIFITLFVLSGVSLLCEYFNVEMWFDGLLGLSYFDVMISQIANTLIVLSLTSVLSANFGQAYWIEIKEAKLVTPFWGCFIGITVYLLTSLIYSIASYALEFKSGIMVSAAASTTLLVVLTFQMISIYFGKEELKKRLRMEYKKLVILTQSAYVSDYLRRLQQYFEIAKNEAFPKKREILVGTKREIRRLNDKLHSNDSSAIEKCHKEHLDKYFDGIKCLEEIDNKIIEFTKNAIDNNDMEVIRENIELLVETENFNTFFDLLEDLFDWDAYYAIEMLRQLSEKNKSWIIKDRMCFFKKYALQKLVCESGKLDAIQKLLQMYDPSNLGMKDIKDKLCTIGKEALLLKEKETKSAEALNEKMSTNKDLESAFLEYQEMCESIKTEDSRLAEKLSKLLCSLKAKDLRSFYIPIEETCIAYEEKKYAEANRYVEVIVANFEQDMIWIKSATEINKLKTDIVFAFSYITQDEEDMIHQLIRRDEEMGMIPTHYKGKLLEMTTVRLDNKPSSGINSSSMEVIRSVLDIPVEQ